jgi:hypothetical protein
VAWHKSYKIIDEEIAGLEDNEIPTGWPSQYLSEISVRDKVDEIFSMFIADTAVSQICFPHAVLARTMKRIQLIHLYGPEVFEESLIDPLKTMKRDILPRFLRSTAFEEMKLTQATLATPAIASELELPIPPTSLSFTLEELTLPSSSPERHFHLNEIVQNRYLYSRFLTYLQDCYCSENLICYRLITLFEEKMDLKQFTTSGTIALDIYRYFVAEGSPYEISLEYSHRKAICLQLAKPTKSCFDMVKRSVYNMLKTYYVSYKNKPEYHGLAQYLRSKLSGGRRASDLLTNCFPAATIN